MGDPYEQSLGKKGGGSKVVNDAQNKIAETTFFFPEPDKTYHITERSGGGGNPIVLPWKHSGLSPMALAAEELA